MHIWWPQILRKNIYENIKFLPTEKSVFISKNLKVIGFEDGSENQVNT